MRGSHTEPLRVAIATDNGITSDVRFGKLSTLYIYEYDEDSNSFEYIEKRSAPYLNTSSGVVTNIYDTIHDTCVNTSEKPDSTTGCATGGIGGCGGAAGKGCHSNEYMTELVNTLRDCNFLLLERIGPRPSRILLREGISTLEKGGEINESLLQLSSYITRSRRAMTHRSIDPVSDDKEE